ncbi:type II toxin-antitoxin system RelE/ParE family toxin [Streptomyces sp. JJ66]|uniref:type II toxin-antitoxin system RelE family toxin n=1 Tax=Streptomyces sp. JJ66 TaxID=2803843 RepID=UPI001C55B361|nr:type II toxin-antitoxin system RelE/ParE family toxin [Streptomyces sp. JJ66]MBW1603746.1 type II toxin-antitoxin system RelE/ParE family toxin [Streptomyces sp. JJ66]
MKYAFRFTTAARRQLRALDSDVAMRILHALTPLGDDPYRSDASVTKLAGRDHTYRLRVGRHRVVYTIDNGELVIIVVAVGNRRDVYRNLTD